MRLIEPLERVLVATVPAIELGELARGFTLKNQVLPFDCDLFRSEEMLFGLCDIAVHSRNDARNLFRVAVSKGVSRLASHLSGMLARSTCCVLFTLLDPDLGYVKVDADDHSQIADHAADLSRFAEGTASVF